MDPEAPLEIRGDAFSECGAQSVAEMQQPSEPIAVDAGEEDHDDHDEEGHESHDEEGHDSHEGEEEENGDIGPKCHVSYYAQFTRSEEQRVRE